MCVEVWGAKVTRTYVPVIARVPPKKERQQSGEFIGGGFYIDLTAQLTSSYK